MGKSRAFSRCRVGLALLSLAPFFLPFLVGCHGHPSSLLADRIKPQTDPAAASAGVPPVQQSPQYREAVRRFAVRDYSAALGDITHLLRQPAYQHRPADLDFLRQQQAICRRAIDPHAAPRLVASVSPPPPPPTPRLASQADCGPRALLLLCPQLGVRTTLDTLRLKAGTTAAGTSLAGLARAAQAVGLKARGVSMDKPALEQLPGPAVAWVDGNHYVALLSIDGEQATIHDPNHPQEEVLPVTALLQRSGGILLTLSR